MVGDFSVTEQVVLLLADGLQNSGHIIYTDSYYTSPNLVRELQRQAVGHCGIVRAGRKNMPPALLPANSRLRNGDDPKFMKSQTSNIMACGWHDTKYVAFLSSIHSDNTIDKRMKSGKN
ncbi:hypothetical protein ACOMHN_047135 [Nucella lapillus]